MHTHVDVILFQTCQPVQPVVPFDTVALLGCLQHIMKTVMPEVSFCV